MSNKEAAKREGMVGRPVFARQATGIVRSFSALDSIAISVGVIALFGFGNAVLPSTLDATFPGGDLFTILTLAMIACVFLGLVYALMGVAMPRSGGDYVYMSRSLAPSIGFAVSLGLVFFGTLTIGPDITYGISTSYAVLFGALGVLTGNNSYFGTSAWLQTPSALFGVGTLLLIVMALISMLPPRPLRLSLRILFLAQIIASLVAIALMASSTQAQFQSAFNAKFGSIATYDQIISKAQAAGWANRPISFAVSVTAIGFGIYTFWGWTFPAYVGGEIRKASRGLVIGIIGGLLIAWALISMYGELAYSVFGRAFVDASGYLATVAPASYPLPVAPWTNFLATLLTHNPIIIFLLLIGAPASWLLVDVGKFLMASRVMFAWSFDRIVPQKIAYVNEKTRGPLVALLIAVIIGEIALYLAAYTTILAFYLNAAGALYIALVFVSVAAIVFPFRQKGIFQNSPSLVNRRIGRVPVLSVLGIVSAGIFIPSAYWSLTVPILGPTATAVYLLIFGVYALGFVIYYGTKFYRKRKEGIDLDLLFKEIPPE
jgi:APA family basic amino acid/polyamine antiporter